MTERGNTLPVVIRGLGLVALVLVLLAGCAGDDEADTGTDTGTTTAPVETATLSLYWLRDGKVWPAARQVGDILFDELAVDALLRGPTDEEQDELGLSTALPEDVDDLEVQVEDGVATVEFEGSDELSQEALAQVVYTETAYPGVDSVAIGGTTYTRADFEEVTPPVLVESPLSFDEVTSPIRAQGTANTFEANFQYEVRDPGGDVVDENFVTATSGTGTRGTFDFTTADFDVSSDGEWTLVVFEHSAEDGSRMNEVEIPLRLTQG